VGVVNHLARRGRIQPGSELFGKAFESWIFHELSAHASYSQLHYDLSFWRLSGGTEVDFVVDDLRLAIEVKGTARVTSDHLRGLRELAREYPRAGRRLLVCREERARKTEDGIEILPYATFLDRLWGGELAA